MNGRDGNQPKTAPATSHFFWKYYNLTGLSVAKISKWKMIAMADYHL